MVQAQRFRARKVDFKRPLPVYRAADLDDLDDDDNRQTDAIETGVEKEEESEHHLQAAISATHAAVTGSAPSKQVYIPTPDASRVIEGYDERYPKTFTCPTSLIRSSETVEECCAPMYCMDDEDERWLNDSGMDVDAFETAMDQLETLTRDMVFQSEADIPTIEYLAAHAADREQPFDTNACTRVYMHWRHRRSDRGFRTVEARLQQEDTSKTEIDPYVCFRRREIQRGRKTRRADQRSLEQLRRLRLNLAMAAQLLELCLEREAAKLRAAGEAQAVAAQRAEVVRMRRRVGATGSSWDELFVPPAQPGAARKRLARDPLRARVPRKTKGNSSAGAGDLALPLPFVLPRAVSVQPYVNVRRLQVAQSRIEARTQTCESRLSAWVDSTYAAPVSSEPALFWPAGIDGLRALRVRRGRLGRLFVDRRAVRSCPMDDERQQQFRLGLLRPEDHERLRQCRAPPASAAPDELLKPFAFANALLTPPESTVDELGATRSTLSAGTQDESEPATPPAPMAHPQLPLALAALSPRIGSGSAPLSTAKCN